MERRFIIHKNQLLQDREPLHFIVYLKKYHILNFNKMEKRGHDIKTKTCYNFTCSWILFVF